MIGAYIFRSALQDFVRLKRVAVWVAVALGLYVVAQIFQRVTTELEPKDAYSLLSSILVFRLLPLVSAIFSTAVLSQEVEQKTIVYLLTRPVPRWQLLLFRTLASALVVALIGTLSAVVVSFAAFGGGAFSNEILFRDLKAIWIGALAYGSLFVLVSLLINRAMIVCLLFAFAWETSISNLPGNMYILSLNSYLTALAERPSSGMTGADGLLGALAGNLSGANVMSANTAWTVLIPFTLFCLAVGAWWFTHFEYVPREDAE